MQRHQAEGYFPRSGAQPTQIASLWVKAGRMEYVTFVEKSFLSLFTAEAETVSLKTLVVGGHPSKWNPKQCQGGELQKRH